MKDKDHILLIAYTFPPSPGIGGRRWAKFAKYLAARGYIVHVITAQNNSSELSLWNEDVLDNKNILCYPLPSRYPAVLQSASSPGLSEKIRYHFWMRVLPLFIKGSIYDKAVMWEKVMLGTAEKLIREYKIRNVIATGAPFRVLYFSCKLKNTFPGIHLVNDFRDPWTEGKSYGFEGLSASGKKHEFSLEDYVFKNADIITAPSETIINYLEKQHRPSKARTAVLPHAFDEDEFVGTGEVTPEPGKVKVIFSGTVYEGTNDYLEAVMRVAEKIKNSDKALYDKLSFSFYTWSRNDIENLALQHHVSEKVRVGSPLPPKKMFSGLAASDYVLVIFLEKYKDYLSTKFYEIIHLNRFIIYMGPEGKVSEFIRENKLGVVISDENEIEPVFLSLFRDVKKSVPYPFIKDFSFEKVTDQLESLLV